MRPRSTRCTSTVLFCTSQIGSSTLRVCSGQPCHLTSNVFVLHRCNTSLVSVECSGKLMSTEVAKHGVAACVSQVCLAVRRLPWRCTTAPGQQVQQLLERLLLAGAVPHRQALGIVDRVRAEPAGAGRALWFSKCGMAVCEVAALVAACQSDKTYQQFTSSQRLLRSATLPVLTSSLPHIMVHQLLHKSR